jgi:antitoxin YefM
MYRKEAVMHAMSYTSARANLAKTMKKVCENHDPVIITRKKTESVVMLSLEDFESISETNYLLKSPANASRLCESVRELNEGKGRDRKLLQ